MVKRMSSADSSMRTDCVGGWESVNRSRPAREVDPRPSDSSWWLSSSLREDMEETTPLRILDTGLLFINAMYSDWRWVSRWWWCGTWGCPTDLEDVCKLVLQAGALCLEALATVGPKRFVADTNLAACASGEVHFVPVEDGPQVLTQLQSTGTRQ